MISMQSSSRRDLLSSLDAGRVHDLAESRFNVQAHQLPTAMDWRTWVMLGGRGSGKTFAGAWLINNLAAASGRRMALVGPTLHDVREVMVEGPSGLKALPRGEERPRWEGGRKRLIWPNHSVAYAFSAEDPDSLRGPQFHDAWADEFCAWRKPTAVLDNLRLGLRLGDDPRLIVTTTPRPTAALRRLLAEEGVQAGRAGTEANAGNLSPGFLKHLRGLYGGTRLEAQELEGLIVESEGALFRAEDLARCRGAAPPRFDRVVVAVDPPATATGDACGIVVVGAITQGPPQDWHAVVLEDASVSAASPDQWARAAIDALHRHGADRLVAEVNQGGDLVQSVIRQVDALVPYRAVHASRGKVARAEPVAALYEQGRVRHLRGHAPPAALSAHNPRSACSCLG